MSREHISIFGLGYVGQVHAVGFALLNYRVVGFDVDDGKLRELSRGAPTVYEEGLSEGLRRALESRMLEFTSDPIMAVTSTNVTFITVGTPNRSDNTQDLSQVIEAAKIIGEALRVKRSWHLVVVKSTVLPGTTDSIIRRVIEEYSGLRAYSDFGLAVNPEFLREGIALRDFFKPDRIVLGIRDEGSRDHLLKIYEPIDAPKVIVDPVTAEMVKYASNAFLAVKLSFANEIGNICKILGIDSREVLRITGMDHRIGQHYFATGLGFGGSCLPKDLRALIEFTKSLKVEPRILKAALEVNENQVNIALSLLKKHLGSLKNRKVGILGLSFKPGTDDVRESRGLILALRLIDEGAEVHVHDPRALYNAKIILGDKVIYHTDANSMLNYVEAVIIATEWFEYENLDYKNVIVVDGRRIEKARREARVYEGLAW
ncbi:MAG: UDP-glucose/GDP-mannose dehydrogenase family protein [Acidilobaceae archaeon]